MTEAEEIRNPQLKAGSLRRVSTHKFLLTRISQMIPQL